VLRAGPARRSLQSSCRGGRPPSRRVGSPASEAFSFYGLVMQVTPVTTRVQRLTLVATCLAVLMVQIDTTVVNLALRAIQIGLGGGVTVLQWVVDAYNVVYASLILTGGALATCLVAGAGFRLASRRFVSDHCSAAWRLRLRS
jgi:hypothetical protein